MDNKHSVVRTDALTGTDVRSQLVSVKYMGTDGKTATAIDNGHVVAIDALVEGEREIFVGKDMTGSESLGDVVLIASEETMYDNLKKNLDDFTNAADDIARGYHLNHGDMFSVTSDALEGTPAVGSKVALKAGTKLEVGGSGTVIGKIIAIETTYRYTYNVIKID